VQRLFPRMVQNVNFPEAQQDLAVEFLDLSILRTPFSFQTGFRPVPVRLGPRHAFAALYPPRSPAHRNPGNNYSLVPLIIDALLGSVDFVRFSSQRSSTAWFSR